MTAFSLDDLNRERVRQERPEPRPFTLDDLKTEPSPQPQASQTKPFGLNELNAGPSPRQPRQAPSALGAVLSDPVEAIKTQASNLVDAYLPEALRRRPQPAPTDGPTPRRYTTFSADDVFAIERHNAAVDAMERYEVERAAHEAARMRQQAPPTTGGVLDLPDLGPGPEPVLPAWARSDFQPSRFGYGRAEANFISDERDVSSSDVLQTALPFASTRLAGAVGQQVASRVGPVAGRVAEGLAHTIGGAAEFTARTRVDDVGPVQAVGEGVQAGADVATSLGKAAVAPFTDRVDLAGEDYLNLAFAALSGFMSRADLPRDAQAFRAARSDLQAAMRGSTDDQLAALRTRVQQAPNLTPVARRDLNRIIDAEVQGRTAGRQGVRATVRPEAGRATPAAQPQQPAQPPTPAPQLPAALQRPPAPAPAPQTPPPPVAPPLPAALRPPAPQAPPAPAPQRPAPPKAPAKPASPEQFVTRGEGGEFAYTDPKVAKAEADRVNKARRAAGQPEVELIELPKGMGMSFISDPMATPQASAPAPAAPPQQPQNRPQSPPEAGRGAEPARTPQGAETATPPAPTPSQAASDPTPPQQGRRVRLPARFTRAEVERQLIDAGRNLPDVSEQITARLTGTELEGESPFRFSGPVPPEVRDRYERQPHMRTRFKGNDPRGRGEDLLAELGDDQFFALADSLVTEGGRAGQLRQAKARLRGAGEVDPQGAFLAYLHDQIEAAGTARKPMEVIDPNTLDIGTTFTVQGEPFEVVRDEFTGDKLLEDGVTVPAEAFDEFPVDQGSVKQAEPEPAPARRPATQQGLPGVGPEGAFDGPATGSRTRELFGPEPGKSQADKADEAFRASQTPKDAETQEMFGDTGDPLRPKQTGRIPDGPDLAQPSVTEGLTPAPPQPSRLPGGRRSGATNLIPEAAAEMVGAVRKHLGHIQSSARPSGRLARMVFQRATTYIQSLGSAGRRLSGEILEVDRLAAKRAGNDAVDVRKLLSGVGRTQREQIAKYLNRRIPASDLPPALVDRAERLRKVLDRGLTEAQKLGVRRRVGGKLVPLQGSGKPFPQVPNAQGRKLLEKAASKGTSDAEVAAVLDMMVQQGQASSPEAALGELLQYREDMLRGVNRYYERSRLELPEQYVEWDAAHILPGLIERNALFLEGIRKWGLQHERAKVLIDQIRRDRGTDVGNVVDDFLAIEFGAGGRVLRDSARIAGAISNYQTAARLGFSVMSALRNMGQRYTNTASLPISDQLRAMWQFPPFIHPWMKSARQLAEQIERAGAIRGRTALADVEGSVVGERVTDAALALFSRVERGNQTYTAYLASISLQRDIDRLLRLKDQGRLRKIMDSIATLSIDRKGAIQRRIERLGMTNEKVAEILSSGRRLTEDEIEVAMWKLVNDTQFPLTLATKRIWWQKHPWYRLLAKFKPFSAEQTGHIYNSVLREAFRGNLAPLVKFVTVTMLMGELYNIAMDLVRNREESLTLSIMRRPDKTTPQGIGLILLNDLVDGGGVGIFADAIWGISDFVMGPVGSTVSNLLDAGADVVHNPRLLQAAIRDFAAGEITVGRDIRPQIARLDKLIGNEHNVTIEYQTWRGRAFDFRERKENPSLLGQVKSGALSTLQGRTQFQRSERSLPYEYAAHQVTVGDIEDAADYLKGVMASAETPDDQKKLIAGIRGSMLNRSPLGPVAQADLADLLAPFDAKERARAVNLQRHWIDQYIKAIGQGMTAAGWPAKVRQGYMEKLADWRKEYVKKLQDAARGKR